MWTPRNALARTECKRYYGAACCSELCVVSDALTCCTECREYVDCRTPCRFVRDFARAEYRPGETLFFVLPGGSTTKKNNPRPARYREGANKFRPIPSKRYKNYEREKLAILDGLGLRDIKIDYPVNVRAIYYREARRRVDLINLHSALHDMLVQAGVLTDDNCRVIVSTDGSRVRYDKDDPRTEVWIEPVGKEEMPW